MATLAQLRERVKSKLKDPEFDDAKIDGFLNDSQNEILGEAEYEFCEKIDENSEITSGEMDVPRDFQTTELLQVYRNGSFFRTLEYMPFRVFFDRTSEYASADRNYKFTCFGGKIFFHVPGVNKPCEVVGCEELWEIRHFYLAKPVQMDNDKSVTLIPDEFSECVLLGAVKRAEQARDNFDYAQIYDNDSVKIVENMKRRYGPRQNTDGSKSRLPYGHIERS